MWVCKLLIEHKDVDKSTGQIIVTDAVKSVLMCRVNGQRETISMKQLERAYEFHVRLEMSISYRLWDQVYKRWI